MEEKKIQVLEKIVNEYNAKAKEYNLYSVPIRLDENDIEIIERNFKFLC